jgi:hypothetical protein
MNVEKEENQVKLSTLEKWKTCKIECSVNITNDFRSLAHCNMCTKFWVEGMPYKKEEFSEWLKTLKRKKKH